VIEPFCLEVDLVRALHFIAIRLERCQPSGQEVQALSEPLPMRDVVRIEANEIPDNDFCDFVSPKECSFIGIRQSGKGHTSRQDTKTDSQGKRRQTFHVSPPGRISAMTMTGSEVALSAATT
jgi:hypothetical protein